MNKPEFDYEAVMLIAAHAATRLGLGVDTAMSFDTPAVIAAAVEVFGGQEEIDVLTGQIGFMVGIELGIRVALAVVAEPLDPRERLLAALKAAHPEVARCAEMARSEIEMRTRTPAEAAAAEASVLPFLTDAGRIAAARRRLARESSAANSR